MKIVSFLCAAAMLAGCSGNNTDIGSETNISSETPAIAAENTSAKTAEDKSETASDTADDTELYIPKDKLGEGIIDNILSEYISDSTDAKIMSDENAAKLEEAFRNIRINNSRFALPMMIMALPKGFSVKIDYDDKSEKITEDFCIYSGELYMDDEMCAYVTVMMREDSEEKYGIIFGITAAMSKNETYLYFGRAAAKLDDFVNFIPARISAYLMIAVVFLIGGNSIGKCFGKNSDSSDCYSVRRAFTVYRRDRRKHASPNSAQTESVCAGALGIRLAGDAVYFGKRVSKPYIGDALRKVEYEDIRRANRLMYGTAWLCEILCLGGMILCSCILYGGSLWQ